MFVFAHYNCSDQIIGSIAEIDSSFCYGSKPLYYILDNSGNFDSSCLSIGPFLERIVIRSYGVNLGYFSALLCAISYLKESGLSPQFLFLLNPDLEHHFSMSAWLDQAATICSDRSSIGIISPAVLERSKNSGSLRFSRVKPRSCRSATLSESVLLFLKALLILRPVVSFLPPPRTGLQITPVVHGSSMCFTRTLYQQLPPTIPIFLYGEEQYLEVFLRDKGLLCCIDHDHYFIHQRSGPTKLLSRLSTALLYFTSSVVSSYIFRH